MSGARSIRVLPKEVVDRIAAGEVIERPASAVKELVENALDAGATEIDVELELGGKRRLVVTDNGCGMGADDLELAFFPHATSKLSEVDDLLAIASYGFRGEALSSIGAVSRARIASRRASDAGGCEVRCEGGETSPVKPCGTPVGTRIEVGQLFFNVPARARFLKGDAAETARCVEQAIAFALVADGVGFRVRSGSRTLFSVDKGASRRDRLGTALGRDAAATAIAASGRRDGVIVEALLLPPSQAKATASAQHVFLNGRTIRDATVKAAVKQAYREFLAPVLQPAFVVLLTIDPSQVDVNVHPAKTEVRFRDSTAVFRAVYHAVLDALRGADLAPRPLARAMEHVSAPTPPPPVGRAAMPLFAPSRVREAAPPDAAAIEPVRAAPLAAKAAVPERTGRALLRLFETYVAYEAGDELVLVDQHALHERILYEKLRAQHRAGEVPRQRLLVPAVVEVGRAAVIGLDDRAAELAQVGLDVTALSQTEVAVHSVPALLQHARPDELVAAALSSGGPGKSASVASLEDRMHHLACRAAVKAGDALAEDELRALLEQAERLPESQACPHGRPTAIKLGRGDLERWFKRSGF